MFAEGSLFYTSGDHGWLIAFNNIIPILWLSKCVGFSKYDPSDALVPRLTLWKCNRECYQCGLQLLTNVIVR